MSEPIHLTADITPEMALPNVPVLPVKEDSKPGPESLLTDELTLKIRKLVLENKSYIEIQQTLGINENTWDTWVWKNYKDFRTDLNNWIHERIVKKSRRNLEEFVDLPVETIEYKRNWDKDADDDEKPEFTEVVKTDPALVRIKQDSTKFALERLDKENFAQRSEFTGKGGKDLHPEPSDEEKAKLDKLLQPNEPAQPESITDSNQRDTTGTEVPVQ